jgi:L-seryl-tRNA(Ser) seleniumtransferase
VLNAIAKAFRDLPVPVVGRIHEGAFVLDFRCLDDEEAFAVQLPKLNLQRI